MTADPPIRVVRLTPPGRSAIASIAVGGACGAELVTLIERFFQSASGRSLVESPLGKIVFGRWGSGDSGENDENGEKVGEEVVVARISETNIEVHCHGGAAAATAIVNDLCSAGAKETDWREATQSEDPIRDAARLALAKARTERTAGILLDQYHGALRSALEQAIDEMERGDVAAADARLAALLDRATVGLHLTEPWQIVLAGPPNVGKSTLINAIVGYQRAITYAQPGTTRDVVTATTAIDGWPVELSDTAGLRAATDPIEVAGVSRAEAKLASADLQLLVFDLSQAWTEELDRLIERWPQAIVIHNKSDLESAPVDGTSEGRPTGHVISAQSGEGIDALLALITNHLEVGKLEPGDALPFTGDQVRAIEISRGQLSVDRQSAATHLRSLMTTAHLADYP